MDACPARLHARRDRLAAQEGCTKIDLVHPVPVLDTRLLDRLEEDHAGIIDQYVDAALAGLDFRECGCDVGR